MTRLRHALVLLGVALALRTGSAGAEDAPARPPPIPSLTVGAEPGTGPRARFDRDLFAALAQEVGMGLAWIDVPPTDALAALDRGRFDVAAGPFAPETLAAAAEHLALPPVAVAGEAVLRRRGDGSVTQAADLAGKSLGLLGTAADTAATRRLLASLTARVPHRPTLVEPTADLAAGRLAALAGPLDAVAAAWLARPDLFEVLGPPLGRTVRLAPAVRRGALAETLAGGLRRMRADGRLAALQQRWFGLVFDPPDAPPVPAQATPASTSKP